MGRLCASSSNPARSGFLVMVIGMRQASAGERLLNDLQRFKQKVFRQHQRRQEAQYVVSRRDGEDVLEMEGLP